MGCSRQESAFEDTSLSERGVIRTKGIQFNFPEPDLKGKVLIAARQPDANDSVLYHSLLGWASGDGLPKCVNALRRMAGISVSGLPTYQELRRGWVNTAALLGSGSLIRYESVLGCRRGRVASGRALRAAAQ